MTGDSANPGVNRLDAGVALVGEAGAAGVRVEKLIQRLVNILGFVGAGFFVVFGVLNAYAGLFKHVFHAGARPGAQIEKSVINVTERIKTDHGRINPAVDGNVRRA